MLAEWLRYFSTPCPRHLRSLGYLRQLIGLQSRYRRCGHAWAEHLENSKELILDAAARAGRGRVLVLGSGLLLDVPLTRLVARGHQVVLADLIHLAPVRRFVQRFADVSLVEVDVTGVALEVYQLGRSGTAGPLPDWRPDNFLDDGFDLVVSANLLSQLPLVPLEYLQARRLPWDPQALDQFARALVLNHLTWLRSFRASVCLITDVERLVYDGSRLVDREDALWGVAPELSGRCWTWRIAPRGEVDRRYELRHRVCGITDLEPVSS